MTSSDPECLLLAGGDLKLTDVRLDHFSSDGPHSASPRQPPSFEEVGVTRQTQGEGASGWLDTNGESVQLISFHRQSLNKHGQQDRDEGAYLCCETKGSRGRRDGSNSRVWLSGRKLPLVVCVIPIRLHYSLISRRATQPGRTGQSSSARLRTRHTCHLR